LEVLTPPDVLKGSSFNSFPEPDVTHVKAARFNQWQQLVHMQQSFWRKWSTEYLSSLQERSKWKSGQANKRKGDVVLLKDENLPPFKWNMGRLEEIISGQDGIIRVAMARTTAGLVKRVVAKLAVLRLETELVESGYFPT